MGYRDIRSALAVSTAIYAMAAAAPALAQTKAFNVPAQPAATGIPELARQADVQILVSESATQGKSIKAVRGTMSVEQALRRALAGTGLRASTGDGRTFTLKPDALSATSISSRSNGAGNDLLLGEEGDPEASASEVVVTGTRIRGVKGQAAPQLTISRREIERTGYSTVQDIFSDLPQNLNEVSFDNLFGGVSSRAAGNNSQGAAGISLRGLGPESTLTLLNGMRRAGAVYGQVVDISAIPLSVVERVDIVTGGASAVYGADAVAGVVNIITRRDFKGAESQAYFGFAEHGAERLQLSQVIGVSGEKAGFVAANEYLQDWNLRQENTGLSGPSPFGAIFERFDIRPSGKRHSGFVSGHLELAGGVSLHADGMYSHSRKTSFLSWGIPGVFSYEQNTDVTSEQISGSIGADITLSSQWKLKVDGAYSRVKNYFRPDAASGDAGSRDGTRLKGITATAEGRVASLGSADIRGVIGLEYREESQANIRLSTGVQRGSERNVRSAFGELLIPLVPGRRGNGLLELTAAGRFDDYSDFGKTFNPETGLRWKPSTELTIRGTYAKAFRAPALSDLALENLAYLRAVPDPTSTTGSTLLLEWTGGNSGLKAERATSFTLGFDYAPAVARGLKLSVSYFDFRYRGRIDQPLQSGTTALGDETSLAGLIDRNPSSKTILDIISSGNAGSGFINASGIAFDPAAQNLLAIFPRLVVFDNRRNNVGIDYLNGLDIQITDSFGIGSGNLHLGFNGTYYFNYDRRITQNSAAISLLNQTGRLVDFRFRASVGWAKGPIQAFAYLNYVDSYKDVYHLLPGIHSWTTGDVLVAFDTSKLTAAGPLRNLKVALSIDNLFGAKPPLASHGFGFGYDAANANPLGRYAGLRVTKGF